MKPTIKRPSTSGFTLVELLVVISIIVILASMGFGAGMVAINKARKTQAKNDCVNLVNAVGAYFDDYSRLPSVGSESKPGERTEPALMNILIGFDTSENQKGIRYFSGKQCSATTRDTAFGGLFYSGGNNVELFDPWKKEVGLQRHYFVLTDLDYNDKIRDPTQNFDIRGRKAVAWSSGQDGRFDGAQNTDNVYSWK